jgi:hydrogenase maturation factor HypE
MHGGEEVLLASTLRLGGELALGARTAAQLPTNGH